MPAEPALIGIDWGTSAFRAFLLDAEGAILDRRGGPHGIMAVRDGDFADVLATQAGAWLGPGGTPILMSGMIGSRQGWVEAPYVECPAGLDELAASLTPVRFNGAEAWIAPGLAFDSSVRDVMRGEETQIFGALAAGRRISGRFVLPGTHSKWATAAGGAITGFATYMTGEIYAACRDHTILGRLMEPGEGPAAFVQGVAEGARAGSPGALLNRLFGVRTLGLSGAVPNASLADYLSGLLIGAEIADADGSEDGPVNIIASDGLAERYVSAARQLGIEATIVSPDVVASGHLALARAAGLLGG